MISRKWHSSPLSSYDAPTARNAKLSIIDTVGHIPQIEGPDEFNRRLVQFLTDQKIKVDAAR